MNFEQAIQMAAELAVEANTDPGNDFVTHVSLPTLERGVFSCNVFEGTVQIAHTLIYEDDARSCLTVGDASKWTTVVR